MKIVEFKDYDNQTTPLSAYNLNRLQQNLITTKYQMTFSSAVSGGSTITLPCYYQVGQDTLDVYLNSELLKKASTKDSEGHYYEVGNSDTKSNQIKITSDWSIASGDVLNLIVRGTTDSYDQNLSPDKATQLADEISANKEEITALQTENSRLKGITNALPKISGEDTSLTLTNTANAPLSDIILKGNTSQQKYSGKNLLNNDIDNTTQNGITIQHDDNSVTINGTNTGTGFRRDFKNNITFKANTNYTVYIKVISGNFKPFKPNVDWAAMFFIENNSITIDNKSSNFIMNFTPTKDIKVLPYFWFGWDSNNVQGQYSIFNNFKLQIMIVEGNYTSSTIPSYEPYVGGIPSPNPDYPQDIKVVTGDNKIIVSGKNLVPITAKSVERNGVTFTINNNQLTINGTATNYTIFFLNNEIWRYSANNLILEAGTYNLSFNNEVKFSGGGIAITIYNENSEIIYEKVGIKNNFSFSISEKGSCTIRMEITKGQVFDNNDLQFQIEQGSTATDYEPYVGRQDFPISLGSLELCQIGDYQDYFYKSGSIWYLHKEINKIASYNGETITTSYISTTGELSTGAKVYYVVTPTDTKITDTTLISQLNALYNAYTYNDTTNISQTNANLPFYLDVNVYTKTDEKLESKQDKLIAGTGIEITGGNTINNIQGNYSTDEIRIGTWRDGKPLYRKIVSGTFGTVTQDKESTVEINLPNVKFVLVDKYWLDRISSNQAINQGPIENSISLGYTSIKSSDSTVRFRTKQSWASNIKVYAIIIYTKTTD